jgi:hypothetical protein
MERHFAVLLLDVAERGEAIFFLRDVEIKKDEK